MKVTEKKALKKEYSQKSDKKLRHFWNLDISKMSRSGFLAKFLHLLGNLNKIYKI